MKYILKMKNMTGRLIMFLILIGGLQSVAYGALTKSFYAANSVLSSGNWVKVGVEETGVYEISYATLESMGFSDPSKVSVYGRGGRVLPESFVTNAGVPVLTDDLTPVKVLHEDNKLYFYGLGPEEISFNTSDIYSIGGYFERKTNNIYSFRGYYFLTDSKPVSEMAVKNYDATTSQTIDKGISYIYHELDSVQNNTISGQLFWGEDLRLPDNQRRKWKVSMPDATAARGVMQCVLYITERDRESHRFIDSTVSFGFEGDNLNHFSTPYVEPSALYYAPHEPSIAEIDVPGKEGNLFVEYKTTEQGVYANLDFWVVSYERQIPNMKDSNGNKINQQLLAFPSVAKGTTSKLELEDAASLVVWDVSTVTDPQRLKINQKGSSYSVGIHNTNKTPILVIFDKDKPQKQISGYQSAYSQIESQNLHSYKEEGADFVIITVPSLKKYAEEIASLHRKHDKISVIVATTEECYNEFSGGVPDPMAYRSFAKMLYMSNCPPKNMLLLGPLYSDFRGVISEKNPAEGIIAYQSPTISITRGAHNINDFYGMMSDKFRTDYYERNEVNIGIGILPVKFDSEAEIIVTKIKNFLERDDHAYYLNRYTAIGGVTESDEQHIHESQVRDLYNTLRSMDNFGTIVTPISIDSYGSSEAHKKFVNQLNEGCSMFSYFGHGAEQFMGKNGNFFNAGDVFTLRNKVLPLALFGGCQITNSDRGYRGLGETLVISTPYGAIGSVVSARDTWSGQNFEFFKQFFISIHTKGTTTSSPHRYEPATIGEIYAEVKTNSTYSNELAYQLLCDPALVIPTINRSLSVKANMPSGVGTQLFPGDTFSLSGSILDSKGQLDSSFNGEIVVRVNEPVKTIPIGMIESKVPAGDLAYEYRDSQVTMNVAKVKDGKFDIEIYIPSSMKEFTGKDALLYCAAYDKTTRTGAAQGYSVPVGKINSNSSENSDKIAPVIERLEFLEKDCSIALAVSDNIALNYSTNPLNKGLTLYIDGKERTEAVFVEPRIETTRPAFSKEVLIDGLKYGEHTAMLKVKDAAGNVAEQEIVFTYNPLSAKYTIKRSEESTPESTMIEFEGSSPSSSVIVVLSSSGSEVWRSEFTGNSVEWHHEFSGGGKVPSGHYKAYIIETGKGMQKGHSEPIDIPVI